MTQTAALFGDDYPTLGEIGVVTLGGAVAAISRGRFPKGYPHVDPNEDAALIAASDTATLLAVADGHNGFEAARAVIEAIAALADPLLEAAEPDLSAATVAASSAVAEAIQGLTPPRSESRTALSLVVIRNGQLHSITAGDTMVAVIRDGHTRVLSSPTPFLGPHLDTSLSVAHLALEAGDLVVVASDGLPDFLGRDWPGRLPGLASDTCEIFVRAAVAAAFAGGAGDNIAVAATRV